MIEISEVMMVYICMTIVLIVLVSLVSLMEKINYGYIHWGLLILATIFSYGCITFAVILHYILNSIFIVV